MRSKSVWVLLILFFAAPINADLKSIYVGASYLNNNSEFREYASDDSGLEIALGYSLSRHLAAEVSYLDLGVLHLPNIPDAGGSIESDGIALQMVAKYPVDRFTFYGKLGSLWWNRDGVLDSVTGPVKFESDGNDLILGFGASYDVTTHLDINIEYKGTRFGHDSDLGSIGISYRF
jgi:opacity protein-like surface antigen